MKSLFPPPPLARENHAISGSTLFSTSRKRMLKQDGGVTRVIQYGLDEQGGWKDVSEFDRQTMRQMTLDISSTIIAVHQWCARL